MIWVGLYVRIQLVYFSRVSVDRLYTSPGRYWVNYQEIDSIVLYRICARTGAVLGGLHSFMYTFKQVGNGKTRLLLAYSTNCIKPTFAPPILRPLACCARGQLPPSASRSLRHWAAAAAAATRLNTVWVKIPPPAEIFWHFLPNGWECLVQILHAYYTFLSTMDYKFLFNYLQLWQSYAILSATTIMCSECPPSAEPHAGWSHLIWHNFVTVGDNWIKICTLAYIWTLNRRVKQILTKNFEPFKKMSKNASVRFHRWLTFCARDVNCVVTMA